MGVGQSSAATVVVHDAKTNRTLDEASSESDQAQPALAPSIGHSAESRPIDRSPGDLLAQGTHCGLAYIRATTARIAGVDPALGGEAQHVLCLDVCGAEAGELAKQQRDPMDIVLVIDTSGSMCNVMREVQETCMQVYTALQDNDRIALVSFSSDAQVLLSLSAKASTKGFFEICQRLQAGGGTNMQAGLHLGIGQFKQAGASGNTAMAMILSDGDPTVGERGDEALARTAACAAMDSGCAVTIHALGFTQHHRVELMSQLPQSSNGPPGSYYYLGTQSDMPAAVGDCLGAGSVPRPCRGLKVSLDGLAESELIVGPCRWYGPVSNGEGALLGLQPPEHLTISALQEGERQVNVFVIPPGSSGASLRLTWESDAGSETFETRLALSENLPDRPVVLLPECVPSSVDLKALAITAHVLRLQVAAALAALAVSPNVGDRYDALHGALLQCLAVLQGISEDADESIESEAVFLEGMLQTLERDLGEALTGRDQGSERRGVLLSFAAEHFAMRSASSLTRVRTAYATRQQIIMRLRFLQSSAGGEASNGSTVGKLECKVDEAGIIDEEKLCRQALEEHSCYVTLASWRECVLGVGLFVHPRTCRERRANVPPQVDLVVDYVSAEAYNLGVRATVQHASSEEPALDSDDEGEAGGPPEVLQSSTRRRINAWLPLHINAANWDIARTFAPSAFSLIATQLNAVFRPEDALKVCARLLCCAVVGFVRSDEGYQRTGASERAVQMYCDVHRLFLRMADDFPVIRQMALQHVQGFIRNPDVRTRKGTPDLGILITYLSILDEVSWSDLCEVFVPEMVRRAFGRMKEPLAAERCENGHDVIARFDALEPEHGRVILFFNVFNSLVARPSAPWHRPCSPAEDATGVLPVAAVCEMYDRRWGQLPMHQVEVVLREIKRMRCMNSVAAVLQELLPFTFNDPNVCELLLWADKHGQTKKAIDQWLPLRKMPTTLTDAWQRGRAMRRMFEHDAHQILDRGGALRERLNDLLSMTALFWERHTVATAQPKKEFRFDSPEEACAAAAAARHRAEERKAVKGKGKGKGNGSGKGSKSNGYNDSDSGSEGGDPHTGDGSPLPDVVVDSERFRSGKPLVLKVTFAEGMSCLKSENGLSLTVPYKDDQGRFATGRTLRTLIASETGLDGRKMRLVAKRVRRFARPMQGEPEDAPLSNGAVLAVWALEEPGVVLEVQRKRRGGKKPGNGWHQVRGFGRTYSMCIAGAIVRETVFSKVEQYFTVVERGSCLELMATLCSALEKDAVVICGGGVDILRHEASSKGWDTEVCSQSGAVCISLASQRLHLIAETDSCQKQPTTIYYDEDAEEDASLPVPMPERGVDHSVLQARRDAAAMVHRAAWADATSGLPPMWDTAREREEFDGGKAAGKGGKGGKGAPSGKGGQSGLAVSAELPVEAQISIPPGAAGAGLIFVIDGHFVRETASISTTICEVCGAGRRPPMPLVHLVTDIRQVKLETEEALRQVAANISADGRMNTTVELENQPCVPVGSTLSHAASEDSPQLPQVADLPAIVSFKLRVPSLGLVTRLRDRFGCRVSEVLFGVLSALLEQNNSAS